MCEDNDKKMYWESVRNLYSRGRHKEKNPRPLESLDWEAVRQADTAFLAKILMSRGMHDKLAERIQVYILKEKKTFAESSYSTNLHDNVKDS